MSIPDAIKRYLSIMKQPQQPKAIADALKDGGMLSNAANFNGNVWTALKRMEDKEVVNTPKGWGLAEWYPSRPKMDEGKKGKKKGSKKRNKKTPAAGSKKESTAEDKPRSAYNAFMSKARKEGKSMQEAAKEWQESKAGK
jgi:hypothetical protein